MREKTAVRLVRIILGISFIVLALHTWSHADDGDDGNSNGYSKEQGIQGPAGPQGMQGAQGPQGAAGKNGTNGVNGVNGTNGLNGTNGKDGKNGSDANAQWKGTDLAADVAVRLFDTKYVQVQAYDTYVFGSEPSQDVLGAGHNQTIGTRVIFKIGKSYEERRLEAQEREIKALEAVLNKVAQ